MFKNYFLFIALCFSIIVISQNIISENAMNSCNDENC